MGNVITTMSSASRVKLWVVKCETNAFIEGYALYYIKAVTKYRARKRFLSNNIRKDLPILKIYEYKEE